MNEPPGVERRRGFSLNLTDFMSKLLLSVFIAVFGIGSFVVTSTLDDVRKAVRLVPVIQEQINTIKHNLEDINERLRELEKQDRIGATPGGFPNLVTTRPISDQDVSK